MPRDVSRRTATTRVRAPGVHSAPGGSAPGARSAPRVPGALGPVGVLALAVVAGLWALGQHGALLVHRCVADGSGLGLRLALLRQDADCPSGLAVGADARQVAAVVVVVTVPVLLAHLVGAGLGLGLLAHVRALVRGVAAVVLGRRPETQQVAALPVPSLVPAVPVVPAVTAVLAGDVRRRGPPALLLA